MLKRKLWRTALRYKAQFISMIIMVALGLGMFVGFNMEWTSIEDNTSYFYELTGFADYRLVNEAGFTSENLESIKAIDGVKDASRVLKVNMLRKEDNDTIAFTVSENEKVTGTSTVKGASYDKNDANGVWLAVKYAEKNDIGIGDDINLVYKNMNITGTVRGLVQSSEYLICTPEEAQMMPDYEKSGYAFVSPAFLKKALGREYYSEIHVISDMEKVDFSDKANAALNSTTLLLTKEEIVSYKEAQGEVEEGKTMAAILPVVFLVIALLTMITTMHRITANEKTQIGTLKALGFKDRKIVAHYTSYAFAIGVLGAALGLAVGYGVCYFVMNPNGAMGTYFDMPRWNMRVPGFVWLFLVGMVLLLSLIGFVSVKDMLKGTAADALRAYTPKKMRRIFFERFKFWEGLSFGTKWNVRDIMRHKARSFMTILGVFGCFVIIFASLGLNDTINFYIDNNLRGCYKYENVINLSEECDNATALEIVSKYEGDWSAASSIEMDGDAYSIQVFDLKHDYIGFITPDGDSTKLGDSGVYICKRISDNMGLKIGDTFEFAPFGQNTKFEVKVAGIVNYISEGIMMTKNYADTIGYTYTINQVFTMSNDIASDASISNVQSVDLIINSFEAFMGILYAMIFLLIFVGIVLGIVVLYNLGVMSYVERYKEMATLKVVGFKDKKIRTIMVSQNVWLTIVGVAIGIPGAIALLNYLMNELGGDYELIIRIMPLTYIISIALVFGTSLFVALMVARKNKKINMVEALKRDE